MHIVRLQGQAVPEAPDSQASMHVRKAVAVCSSPGRHWMDGDSRFGACRSTNYDVIAVRMWEPSRSQVRMTKSARTGHVDIIYFLEDLHAALSTTACHEAPSAQGPGATRRTRRSTRFGGAPPVRSPQGVRRVCPRLTLASLSAVR